MEEDEEEEEEARQSLFRIDGTVVPNIPIGNNPWTVARYLKSLRKSPGQLKLGAGFYYKVSVILIYDIILCNNTGNTHLGSHKMKASTPSAVREAAAVGMYIPPTWYIMFPQFSL